MQRLEPMYFDDFRHFQISAFSGTTYQEENAAVISVPIKPKKRENLVIFYKLEISWKVWRFFFTKSQESGNFVKNLIVFLKKSQESGDFVNFLKNIVIFTKSQESEDFVKNLAIFYEIPRIWWFRKKKLVILYQIPSIWWFRVKSGNSLPDPKNLVILQKKNPDKT